MATKRRAARAGAKGTKLGARLGARVAPKAGRVAARGAWRAGKGQAKLTRRALSSREPRGARYMKYGFFALAGLALGAVLSRFASRDETSSSFTGTAGDQTWGGGSAGQTDVGTVPSEHQRPEDPNRTGPERDYSDPSSGPLIGRDRPSESSPEIPVQHEEIENRIRTRIGEDSRTMDMPHVNVEVNDGVAELRGVAPSEEAKQAAGEIAASIEGVSEVRNLITVS
jgi:BON domain